VRSRPTTLSGALAALATVGALAGLTACGATVTSSPSASGAAATVPPSPTAPQAQLASPTAGVVTIDGVADPLLPQELKSYRRTASAVQVDQAYHGTEAAYAGLCHGSVDLVSATAPISAAENAACQAAGLGVVQLEVGAQGIVVATRAESDVGADCVSTDQVKDMFRAGSPVTRWNQLDPSFSTTALHVGGPGPTAATFAAFDAVLQSITAPSITDFRSDYRAFPNDDAVRGFITGSAKDKRLADRLLGDQRAAEHATSQLAGQRHLITTASQELAAAKQQAAVDQLSGAGAARLAQDQTAIFNAQGKLSGARVWIPTYTTTLRAARTKVAADRAAAQRLQDGVGNVAYVGYSYYGLYEDQLRPLEITEPGGTNCIFPSEQTILSGTYPLATRLLLTTTTRSLARPEVRDLLEHYLTHATQEAGDAELVAISPQLEQQELAWVQGTAKPDLVQPPAPSATPSGDAWVPAT
jgi:ABC-type phosphate transport system substrate-binding protein